MKEMIFLRTRPQKERKGKLQMRGTAQCDLALIMLVREKDKGN